MKNRLALLFARLVLAALVLSCASVAQAAPKVVATIRPLHALASAVMDGVGAPLLLIDAAADPHSFQLKPSTAQSLSEADLILWVGPRLEGALIGALRNLAQPGRALALAELPGTKLLAPRLEGVFAGGEAEHGHAEQGHVEQGHVEPGRGGGANYDPHLWLDPANGRVILAAIAAALSRLDPPNAARYAANRAAASAALDRLEGELAALLAPVAGRPFVVLHDAFQYFETRYGLRAVGAIFAGPEHPPSAQRLALLQKAFVESEARCIFGAPQFPSALLAAVASGPGVRQGVLDDQGAELAPGPDAYARLLRGLAESYAACLAG